VIEWRDEGILLSARPYGESAAIAELFTAGHGRHAGVVRGGASRRLRPLLQAGSTFAAEWRSRLDEHIGAFVLEPVRSSAPLMADRRALAALNAVTGLLAMVLPERDPHPPLYRGTAALLVGLEGGDWATAYLGWEMQLLEGLGYGLDLGSCAATGDTDDLAYVSPVSARAVSREAGAEWADRLLPLPPVMRGAPGARTADVARGLVTTGHFLGRLAGELGRPLPAARDRLVTLLARG
jgi:DNA repair protein RecO (recombination protein O)